MRPPTPKWICFELLPRAGRRKTDTWAVMNVESGFLLGYVSWHTGFRCFAFFPSGMTVFEQRCLRDIAVFLRFRMAERMRAKAVA